PIIKWLRIKPYSVMEDEFKTRSALANALIAHIEENLSFGEVSDQVLAQVKSKYELKAQRLNSTDISGHRTDSVTEIFNQIVTVQLDLIEQERKILHQLRKEHKASDEIVRKIEHELDLEEARLRAELYE
ncbi:MAG: Na+/H+ antiporter, partial [Cytophagales bacterium]|nr:Na+/H+ antiporter [Cytophagales bacterium]